MRNRTLNWRLGDVKKIREDAKKPMCIRVYYGPISTSPER